MTIKIFERTYAGEEMSDVDRDIFEAFDPDFNPKVQQIPQDEYGFMKGTFKVKIEWSPEE